MLMIGKKIALTVLCFSIFSQSTFADAVGYTFTKLPKFSGTHIGTIGLRYSLL